MSTQAVADDLVSMWKAGRFNEAGEKYWADDVASIENMEGPMAAVHGKDAARGKGQWWANAHEVHSVEVDGPYLNGDQFTVRLKMEVTRKEDGQRIPMDEICLYTLKNDKIAEERFFYGA